MANIIKMTIKNKDNNTQTILKQFKTPNND